MPARLEKGEKLKLGRASVCSGGGAIKECCGYRCGPGMLPEAEPDMPKMYRRGGFSLFYPWCAPAHLRPKKQKSIRGAILFGARSFQRDGFRAGKVSIFAILPYGNNCNAIRAESSR